MRKTRNGNPTAVPPFRSGRRSLVCARPSRGKGRYTRGWKPQVSTLLCARAASAHISFASQAATIYNRNRRRKKTLEISTQYDIMEKLKFQCLASLCSQGVLFLPCGIDGAEKTIQVRRVRLSAGVSAADFRGRSVLPRRIPQPHGRAHARG